MPAFALRSSLVLVGRRGLDEKVWTRLNNINSLLMTSGIGRRFETVRQLTANFLTVPHVTLPCHSMYLD